MMTGFVIQCVAWHQLSPLPTFTLGPWLFVAVFVVILLVIHIYFDVVRFLVC
jgi:hypothetical protein